MRSIEHIVVHCSATSPFATVEAIQRHWREVLGWKRPGYHVIIKCNGEAVRLAPDDMVVNGAKGYNAHALHVCYIGGVRPGKEAGEPVAHDTRTPQQVEALYRQVQAWKREHPKAGVLGHRDLPGVTKECPSFDAVDEYRHMTVTAAV